MTPAFVVEIRTPKGFLLRGLWFNQKRAKRAIVFVHGLGGNVFSMRDHIQTWAQSGAAVLTFNNRGHDWASSLSHATKKKRFAAGRAHEIFTDCVDDIEGAMRFVRSKGVREIFLVGHSTGCQKSVYWAYKRGGKGIRGIVLLAPISDYSSTVKTKGRTRIARIAQVAQKMTKRGKRHELLPANLWQDEIDAQRFLSLYSGTSAEELFPYAQPEKHPRELRSVKRPLLVLLAGDDEYGDMPADKIAAWFRTHMQKGKAVVVSGVTHGFKNAERSVATRIRRFMKGKR